MKKALLSLALLLCGMAVNAQGIVKAGANVTVLPSTQYSPKEKWSAATFVYNTGLEYGAGERENANYNIVWGEPEPDANGNMWYEEAYDTTGVSYIDDGLDEPIHWEVHQAPFSSDKEYKGQPSYQWTTGNIMAEIYIRRTFTVDPSQLLAGPVFLACGHDDAPAEYYINGELVHSITDGWNNDEYILLTDEQKALIRLNGEPNLLAVHVHQNWGGAFADCGLYTKVEGGLEMGYDLPWEGKVIFNNIGGYNFDGKEPSNDPRHPWSKLYVAQEGDVYKVHMNGSSIQDEYGDWQEWAEQVHFKTPITINPDHEYTFRVKLSADADYEHVVVKLTDNSNDEIEGELQETSITADGTTEVELTLSEVEIPNLKVAFDFGGGQESTTVVISEMSLIDETDGEKELWVGTDYFNYFHTTKNVVKYFIEEYDEESGEFKKRYVTEEDEDFEMAAQEIEQTVINAPEMEGRVETLSWTQADFDDSEWDDQMMPVGNLDYDPRPASEWPGGDNTNYWIRRNFVLDKVNERLSYALNVCHDDVYETYVNGHLLQKNTHWTDKRNPVQVHIPARYLNVGKNVIATYIQQNWGGRFYDCGINVEEVNYDACADELKAAIAKAETTDAVLTKAMREDLMEIAAKGKEELATNRDAAEIKEYARVMNEESQKIINYGGDVKTLLETIQILNTTEDKGYLAPVLADVKENMDTCKTNGETNVLLDKLRIVRKRNALERHTEKYVGCVPEIVSEEFVGTHFPVSSLDEIPEECKYYYIYNVGEKCFLGGGENWGTHLAIEYASNPMMLVQKMKDGEPVEGQFRIETFRPNGDLGINDFMNWGGFIDTNTQDAWELIPVEGKTNVFNISPAGQTNGVTGGRNYLGFRGGDNQYAPSWNVVDTDMRTPELESNQWMFITKEEMDALMTTATAENPIDATHLIVNPGFDQRLTDSNWYDSTWGGNHSIWERRENHPDFCFEGWNTESFDLAHEITDDAIIPGWYTLRFQGYYRDGNYDNHVKLMAEGKTPEQKAYAYIGMFEENEDITYVRSISDGSMMVPGLGRLDGTGKIRIPDGCAGATEYYFENGLYWNTLKFEVLDGDEGMLLFGVHKDESEQNQDWIVLDNFRLTYYGKEEPSIEDAIVDIKGDEIVTGQKGKKEIYNLAGQRITKLQKGVNIVNGKKYIVK